ncbi:MAG: isoprenyl transferase [Crocinitomicaceae bacterium]|nr:isoprenyl transferase [Crocinitomicaceae bacterium]|tara:strand:- start:261 stop:983 length:723 start_codon:yes stop_codon:yes gene_type:complete
MNGLDLDRIPQHVAIIMDGNGRWANNKGQDRVFGHLNGVESVREAVRTAGKLGIKYLTLYAFSTENWSRPMEEVNALMDLLLRTLVSESKDLFDNGVKLQTIGDLSGLPQNCVDSLNEAISNSPDNHKLVLTLALNYSSKWEITSAVKALMGSGISSEEVDADSIAKNLATAGMPDPELMIRTSGEHRISNFMLWQLAYAEFHFSSVLWPDFREEHFIAAIADYQNRDRRFGGVSQQKNQ